MSAKVSTYAALVRKDLRWLVPAAGVMPPLLLASYMGLGDFRVWRSLSGLDEVVRVQGMLLWLGAASLGLFAALKEDIARTREYLRHRPVSLGTRFLATQAGSVLVLMLWLLALPAHYLLTRYEHGASTADPYRLLHHLATASVVFPSFACGYFAGALSRRWLVGIVLGTPVVALVPVAIHLGWPGGVSANLAFVVLLNMGVAAMLLGFSYLHERAGYDEDRPQAALSWPVRLIALALLSAASAIIATTWQRGFLRNLVFSYPIVVDVTGRGLTLARLEHGRHLLLLGENHDPQAPEKRIPLEHSNEEVKLAWSPWSRYGSGGKKSENQGGGRELVGRSHEAEAYLDQRQGALALVIRSPGPGEMSRRLVLRPDGKRFSAGTHAVTPGVGANDSILIVDPSDRTLWLYDLHRLAEAPIPAPPLPDGDTYVETGSAVDRSGPVIVGRMGSYALANGVFVPARVRQYWSSERHRAIIAPLDPLSFTLRLESTEGATDFHHLFKPRTIREKAIAGLAVASGFLRGPALSVASATEDTSEELRRGILVSWSRTSALDPLLRGNRRPGLLAAVIVFSLALATLAHRRLARLGAPVSRRWLWAGLIAVGGLPAFVTYRLCEPRRAWQPRPEAVRGSKPLIGSLAARSG